MSNRLTWHNLQWKWLIGTSVPICACNCGSITWGSCMKAQRGNQATLVTVIAHNFRSEFSPGVWTRVVHGYFCKCFIYPEKNSSLSSACEGDFLWGTSIPSRDIASQYDLTYRIIRYDQIWGEQIIQVCTCDVALVIPSAALPRFGLIIRARKAWV